MNRIFTLRFWTVTFTFAFISLVFSLSTSAQRTSAPPSWDTAKNPHNFTSAYLAQNGVVANEIIWARTGSDGLSTFSKTSNPNQTAVRVTVTVPAYDQNGGIYFWYPLGELTYSGFTDDKVGFMARETAKSFPIYIFPGKNYTNYNPIAGTRQAPLIDNSWHTIYSDNLNPLGIREVFLVNYTEKAYSKEGSTMRDYMSKKNGKATDDMPLIKYKEDITLLLNDGFITFDTQMDSGTGPSRGHFAISPIISDPRKGVIARDAFLWMSSSDDVPSASERIFMDQFKCLQLKGMWCPAE